MIRIVVLLLVAITAGIFIVFGTTGLSIVAVIAVAYAALSVKIIGPDKMAGLIRLGKFVKPLNSGIHFVLWPISNIKVFPKGIMSFGFTVKSAVTKEGWVEGYDDVTSSTEINLRCVMNAYFDRESLRWTIRNAPGTTAEDLGPILVPYVMDIIRSLVGKLPWRLVNEGRMDISNCILHRLIPGKPCKKISTEIKDGKMYICFDEEEEEVLTEADLVRHSPFTQFGLTRITIGIEDITFTDPEVAKAVNAEEKARLNASGAKIDADAARYVTEQAGAASANARAAMIKVIQGNTNLEALKTLAEMAQGNGTVLYQIPANFERAMSSALGGNDITSMIKALTPEDKRVVMKALQEAIKP